MKKIKGENVKKWLQKLIEDYTVYGVKNDGKRKYWGVIKKPEEIDLTALVSDLSPKNILFPQEEALLFFKEKKIITGENPPKKPLIFFGIRPCDVKAILLMDKVFIQKDYTDPYYKVKRDNAILVGFLCSHPLPTCFCTSVGGGPFNTQGMDVALLKLENDFWLYFSTDKAEEILKYGEFEEGVIDRKVLEDVKKKAEEKITTPSFAGIENLFDNPYEIDFWDEVWVSCLGGGVCTYVCPTCHCFDIVDEKKGKRGVRRRIWDSCMFSLYTLEASGHNPRPTGRERWRQRFLHKFYYFPKVFGEYQCVGCGRCVRLCPVNIDIREIAQNFKLYKKSSKKEVSWGS